MKRYVGNERLYYHSPNINVGFCATIKGEIERDKIISAVTKVCNRHPLTKAVLKTDNKGLYFQLDTSECSIEFIPKSAEEYCEKNWKKWYLETDRIPFDFKHEALVKIGIFEREKEMDIAIIGHHILGDGIGYRNFMADFLRALDGSLDNTVLLPPTNNPLIKNIKLSIHPSCISS